MQCARLVASVALLPVFTSAQTLCTSASPGYYCSSSSVEQTDCTAGYFCPGGLSPMLVCPSGMTSSARSSTRSDCYTPSADGGLSPWWSLLFLLIFVAAGIYCCERRQCNKQSLQMAASNVTHTHNHYYEKPDPATAPPATNTQTYQDPPPGRWVYEGPTPPPSFHDDRSVYSTGRTYRS